jgi:lipopolysaccharide export system protein LptC
MSEAADRERVIKRSWARPGSAHDFLVRFLKIALPSGIGVLLAYLALAPLVENRESSFLLDKNKVEVAREKMRVERAQYRGLDNVGRPFTVNASSAVQPNAATQLVDINGMSANILLDEGRAALRADKGRYDMEKQTVDVLGPILFTAADGYQLRTSDVRVDFPTRTMASSGRVQGSMPLGTFSADRMEADLPGRKVVLTGRARLHIVQGAIR